MSVDDQLSLTFDKSFKEIPESYHKSRQSILLTSVDKPLSITSLKVFNTISLLIDSYVAQRYPSVEDFCEHHGDNPVRFIFPRKLVWLIYSGRSKKYDYRALESGLFALREHTFVQRREGEFGEKDFAIEGIIDNAYVEGADFIVQVPSWAWKMIINSSGNDTAHLSISSMNTRLTGRYAYRLYELLSLYSGGLKGTYKLTDEALKSGIGIPVSAKKSTGVSFPKEAVSLFAKTKIERAQAGINKGGVGITLESFRHEEDFNGDVVWEFDIRPSGNLPARVPKELHAMLASVVAELNTINCSDIATQITDEFSLHYARHCFDAMESASRRMKKSDTRVVAKEKYFRAIYENNAKKFSSIYLEKVAREKERQKREFVKEKERLHEELKELFTREGSGAYSRWLKSSSDESLLGLIKSVDALTKERALPTATKELRAYFIERVSHHHNGLLFGAFKEQEGWTDDHFNSWNDNRKNNTSEQGSKTAKTTSNALSVHVSSVDARDIDY